MYSRYSRHDAKILYYRIIHLRVWEQEEFKNNEHYYIEFHTY
jgi:hypothetical protein